MSEDPDEGSSSRPARIGDKRTAARNEDFADKRPRLSPSSPDTVGVTIGALPFDVCLSIFRFLTVEERFFCRRVCLRWKDIIDTRSLWLDRDYCVKVSLSAKRHPELFWALSAIYNVREVIVDPGLDAEEFDPEDAPRGTYGVRRLTIAEAPRLLDLTLYVRLLDRLAGQGDDRCQSLESLVVGNVMTLGLMPMPMLRRLRYLDLTEGTVAQTVFQFPFVPPFYLWPTTWTVAEKLESLSMGLVHVPTSSPTAFHYFLRNSCPKLRYVQLKDSSVPVNLMSVFLSLPRTVTQLHLKNLDPSYPFGMLYGCIHLPQLLFLSVESTQLRELSHIVWHCKLRGLQLKNHALTDQQLFAFRQNCTATLHVLSFEHVILPEGGQEDFRDFLVACGSLHTLYMSDQRCGLLAAARVMPSLSTLYVSEWHEELEALRALSGLTVRTSYPNFSDYFGHPNEPD